MNCFMQVGQKEVQSAICKAKLWFSQDNHLSTFTFYLQQNIYNHQRFSAEGMLISNLHKALVVCITNKYATRTFLNYIQNDYFTRGGTDKKVCHKEKQDRYLTFLANDKTRKKFTNELYHFHDFNWKLFREIPGNEIERQTMATRVNSKKSISTCSIISANAEYDGKIMAVNEAIKNAVGIEGTILIFSSAEIVYYEGEAPKNRYINL
jgi:hypothetical protein